MSKIEDKDLQDVSGGAGKLSELDSDGGASSGEGAIRDETPTPGIPGGGGPDLNPQGGSGGTTEMGPG